MTDAFCLHPQPVPCDYCSRVSLTLEVDDPQWQAASATDQTIPSFIRPASLIMFWFHGGSQTSCTSASSTPSILRILLCASCAMAGPIPQPGAVNVIFTSTLVLPSSFFVSLQS